MNACQTTVAAPEYLILPPFLNKNVQQPQSMERIYTAPTDFLSPVQVQQNSSTPFSESESSLPPHPPTIDV